MTARGISLGSEGNTLYPVLSRFYFFYSVYSAIFVFCSERSTKLAMHLFCIASYAGVAAAAYN